MRDIYNAGGLTEHYTYDEYNQLTELKTNKISIYTYEYDAEGDRISQKAETKDRFEYGSKYVDTWYDDLSQMDIEEIEDMLQSMDSHTAFDNLRHSIKHRGLCKGNFGQDNVNDAEYGTPSRIDNFTSNYLLDKSEEYTQVLADNDKINIYGEERIATNQWSTYNYYITGLNESVYTTTETTSWSDKQTDIEYTDTGLTDDIDKGYAYNGEVKDVSGLIYLRARYYNPRIGQFVQIDSYTGEDENIASQNRYCYTINNPYKYVDPDGHFGVLGLLLVAGAVIGGTIAAASSKSSKKKKKTGLSKNTQRKIKNAVVNNDLGSLTQKPHEKTIKRDYIKDIAYKKIKDPDAYIKKYFKNTNVKIEKKIPTVCPFPKTLSKEYKSIYQCIYNTVGESGKKRAKSAINIGRFYGEASCLLNYAITSLDQIRGYAINVKPNEYRSTLGRITSYSKSFKKLGKEFNKEVTKHGKNMYRHITSNKSPYKKITYYTSYGDKVAHVHKNSEAYKFFTSSIYKNAIKVGKFTNVVMPIVSNILTSYVVYKKYITNNPNKFNNYITRTNYVTNSKIDCKKLANLNKEQIKSNVPKTWSIEEHKGFVHIKDEKGVIRIRLDPPDNVTKYEHIHIYDEHKRSLDINGNIVNRKSPKAHIPLKNGKGYKGS